jgi:DNA (cytosine-5)-methyltransferase 1
VNYVSLFTGIGGFDLAFDRAGMTPLANVEIDAKARSVLVRHWPNVPQYTDVKEFHAPDGTDLVCGGFPCQDLSVAGRRAGLAGERSGLFYEVARILDEAKPEWVVLENVPGLLSSNGGRDMGAVLGTLADLGYVGAYRVLDAQYFGVAQRRRRVFIVGRLGADGAREVLLEPAGVRRDPAPSREARPEVAGTLGGGSGSRGWAPDLERMTSLSASQRAVGALTTNGVGTCGADDNQAQAGHLIPTHAVSPCLQERGYKGVDSDMTQAHVVRLPIPFDTTQITSAANRSRPEPGSPCHPLAASAHVPAIATSVAVRRLTPTECERLQGFPDGWTDGQADSTRYKQLGNAVAVHVVEWIARRLVAASNAEKSAA